MSIQPESNDKNINPSSTQYRQNFLLLIITYLILFALSQCFVISYLLSLQRDDDIISVLDSIKISRKDDVGVKKSTVVNPKYTKTNGNNLKSNDEYVQKYDGVAATLMINAPKWFQKRYSTMISNIFTNTPCKFS